MKLFIYIYITSISESFYDFMEHKTVLHDVSELGLCLSLIGANGIKVHIKASLKLIYMHLH